MNDQRHEQPQNGIQLTNAKTAQPGQSERDDGRARQ
jgi:hypothetical protein